MVGDHNNGVWQQQAQDFGPQAEKLDRALVTGLMLEVILETSTFPADPQTLRHLVKTRLKDSLAVNLAGRVTLNRFRHLLNQVDIWFPLYYPLTSAGAAKAPAALPVQAIPAPAAAAVASRQVLRVDRLRAWLQEEGRGVLRAGRTARSTRTGCGSFWTALRAAGSGSWTSPGTSGWNAKPPGNIYKSCSTPACCAIWGASAAVRSALEPRFLVVRADAWNPGLKRRCRAWPRTWRCRCPPGSSLPAARPSGKRNGMAAWSRPVAGNSSPALYPLVFWRRCARWGRAGCCGSAASGSGSN